MTTPDAQSVLIAVARLEANYAALLAQVERAEQRRESGRHDLIRQIAVVQEQNVAHQKRRDAELAEIKSDQKEMREDIGEIREALAGGTATRRFIVVALGLGFSFLGIVVAAVGVFVTH